MSPKEGLDIDGNTILDERRFNSTPSETSGSNGVPGRLTLSVMHGHILDILVYDVSSAAS